MFTLFVLVSIKEDLFVCLCFVEVRLCGGPIFPDFQSIDSTLTIDDNVNKVNIYIHIGISVLNLKRTILISMTKERFVEIT